MSICLIFSFYHILWITDSRDKKFCHLIENVMGHFTGNSCRRIHCVKSVQKRSFFWSVFSCIRTENGDLLRKFPYSVQTQENADQKKLRFWTLFTQWYKEKRKKYALDLLLPVNYCYLSRGAGAKSLVK